MTFFPSVIDLWENWAERNWERFDNDIVFAWVVEREQIEHIQMLEAEIGLKAHEIVRRLLGRQNRITIFRIGRVCLTGENDGTKMDRWIELFGRAFGTNLTQDLK